MNLRHISKLFSEASSKAFEVVKGFFEPRTLSLLFHSDCRLTDKRYICCQKKTIKACKCLKKETLKLTICFRIK